jgi:hypothetical protein
LFHCIVIFFDDFVYVCRLMKVMMMYAKKQIVPNHQSMVCATVL